jgi:putative tricarboxylic transport membrane protein
VDVLGNLAGGLSQALSPVTLLLLCTGVLLGMLVGVMPGLGPSAGIAILLPLTFGMEPGNAIVMLAAVYYGAMYGGTITSVLINTPGESATVASTFDGYPLARQGRAGPALVVAAVASFVAGTIGTLLLTLIAPATATVAASFGPPELFLVAVAGLLTIIVVVGRNRLFGAVSALIGFALATVGIDIGGGDQRYTFGSTELINGIEFIPVAIGLFGVSEVLLNLYRGGHLERPQYIDPRARGARLLPGARDWLETRWAMMRGSLIGFLVGIAPGAGATVAALMSYSVEKSVAKKPERFGRGAMAGLAGPEAANNAATSGAMVPLLTLGLPGSASTAVLLGGFLMWGLQPGPLLMEQHPDFAWGLIGSMYLGNVMLLLLNVFCIPVFASVARVPFRVLAPVIIVLCVLGTYTVNDSIVEVGIMLGCGVLGFFMRLYGFVPAATVIALVLGPLAEETLRQTLVISGGSFAIFAQRPASVLLLCAVALLLLVPPVGAAIRGRIRRGRGADGSPAETPDRIEA